MSLPLTSMPCAAVGAAPSLLACAWLRIVDRASGSWSMLWSARGAGELLREGGLTQPHGSNEPCACYNDQQSKPLHVKPLASTTAAAREWKLS